MNQSSLPFQLVNVLACPGEVFEEILACPPRLGHWLVPTLLVCVTSFVLLSASANPDQTSAAVQHLVQEGHLSGGTAVAVRTRWQMSVGALTCLGAFVGTFWSALLLWLMGRVFLKSRFSFRHSLGVVGVSAMVLVLGSIITTLLIYATGDSGARPALSLFAGGLPVENPLRTAMDVLNVFNLWTMAVLAVGLSKLSGVSFKEAAFWVFSYWLVGRLGLILLA